MPSFISSPHHNHNHNHNTSLYSMSRGDELCCELSTSCLSSSSSCSSSKPLLTTSRAALSGAATRDVSVEKIRRQRVAVIGSGAVGSYFGARLWEAGHKVKFLFRGESYARAKKEGLQIKSIQGDLFIPSNLLEVFSDTAEMGTVDWVLVALKSTSLDALPDLLAPLLSSDTRVLVLMNGLIEDDLIRMIKEKMGEESDSKTPLQCCQALFGAMAFLGCCREGPLLTKHTFGGWICAGMASTRSRNCHQEQEALAELWKGSKVKATYEDCLLRGRWRKNVYNIAINAVSVAMGGYTVDQIVNDTTLRKLVETIMDETIAVANADLERSCGMGNFVPLTEADKIHMMGLADRMQSYSTSTTLDLVHRRPMEVRYLFREPVERAHKLGIAVPHMEKVLEQIEAMESDNEHF